MDDQNQPECELDRVEFAPFPSVPTCMHEYAGIDETCTSEATHVMVFSDGEEEYGLYKCNEHTFPFIREQVRANDLGYPPKCQTCRHLGRPSYLKNETDGYADVPMEDDTESELYICEECADTMDLDLHPIEEGPDIEDVGFLGIS